MENKPQNVFEKLDKQGEQIDDLSSKLEGISINDLYALAKRTWNYGDYITAQKYYNHISLLKPLDWEAPLMASLCNFRGRHEIVYWEDCLEARAKLFGSTIQYILSLDLDSDKKDFEVEKCVDIIKKDLSNIIENYYEYKESFDKYGNNYVLKIEACLFDLYNDLPKNHLVDENLIVFVLNKLLDIIDKEKVLLGKISESLLMDFQDKTGRKIDASYNELINNNKSLICKGDLSNEEIKEIQLKGKMFFEYNDKVISNRKFTRMSVCGILLSILAISGIILSLIYNWLCVFSFAISLVYGTILIVMAFTQKNMIKCKSLLCPFRKCTRLSSDGKVVIEEKYRWIRLAFYLGIYLMLFSSGGSILLALQSKEIGFVSTIISIIAGIDCILFLVPIKYITMSATRINGTFKYLYKGKYYTF